MEVARTKVKTANSWLEILDRLGERLAQSAREHDLNDSFVKDNYDLLVQEGFLGALIPKSLGGQGIPHADVCHLIKKIGHNCPSTALAFSMHQHVVATNTWKYIHTHDGEDFLRNVANENLILVSTGANDWLLSSGLAKRVDGGYIVTGKKHFASQSAAGDILVTSAVYKESDKNDQVIHFTISLDSEGIELMDDWYALGMRGTGSQSISLKKVFVPDSSVTLIRPRDKFPPLWNVVITVAAPLIMAPYVGIAERAMQLTINHCRTDKKSHLDTALLIGEMDNDLNMARLAHDDMVSMANNLEFQPDDEMGMAMLSRKTLVAKACKSCLNKAMETVGGKSYFRSFELEKLFRDVQASSYHPLPEKQQMRLRGEYLLRD